MKKRSLISMLVVMAMLVTTFASMFAIGVNAAAVTQPYTFENDAKALEGGAIAKFSNGGYAKTLDDVFAVVCVASENVLVSHGINSFRFVLSLSTLLV